MAERIIVFDMDGVLVEVSESYRATIVETVKLFTGETIARELIQEYKNQGGWNNDWALSQKICADLGTTIEFDNSFRHLPDLPHLSHETFCLLLPAHGYAHGAR